MDKLLIISVAGFGYDLLATHSSRGHRPSVTPDRCGSTGGLRPTLSPRVSSPDVPSLQPPPFCLQPPSFCLQPPSFCLQPPSFCLQPPPFCLHPSSFILSPSPLLPSFPAVTCTAQATFRTAAPPQSHGMVANGLYDRLWRKVHFWEQSSSLVEGERIWSAFRKSGKTVGLLFWQQAMGEDADIVLTPAPIHKHHGGMVLDCYSQPASLYPRLRRDLGEFPLHRYWGPLASVKVGDWIASATASTMRHEAPDLLLTYLPTLDYDLQRFGPHDRRASAALDRIFAQLAALFEAASRCGYEVVFWGDYAIAPCDGPGVLPNLALREAGLFAPRDVRGRAYPDFHTSRAFAVCDHEVAQVHVRDSADIEPVQRCLAALPGVAAADAAPPQAHVRSGELVLTASPGRWFAYPWWTQAREAPEYARHIDIHNKPGFDPCELVGQWFPPGISQDTRRIHGTHGRADRPVAWGGTLRFDPPPATLQELSTRVRDWLTARVAVPRGTSGENGHACGS